MTTNHPHPTAVFFDLGNTLSYYSAPWPNSFDLFADPLCLYLKRHRIEIPDSDFKHELLHKIVIHEPQADENFRESSAADVLREILAGFGYPTLGGEFIHRCLRVMYGIAEGFWTPEEDALATLRELSRRGYKLGVISNAIDDENAQNIIDRGGFRPYLDLTLSSAGFGCGKPGKEIFEYALNELAVVPDQSWMVGDTLRSDILGANLMGIHSVWITRRAVHADQPILDADYVPERRISNLSTLLEADFLY